MLHECQMEDYVETTIFLQPLVWFTQKSQSLETGPCACPGSSQRRQACVDVRSECWTAVCVAMQCVSVGDHFAVNCTFSFPGSGLSPCLVERGTDGVICSMLSWVTASLWITEYGYVKSVFFVCCKNILWKDRIILIFPLLGYVCIPILFLSLLCQCIQCCLHLTVEPPSHCWSILSALTQLSEAAPQNQAFYSPKQ